MVEASCRRRCHESEHRVEPRSNSCNMFCSLRSGELLKSAVMRCLFASQSTWQVDGVDDGNDWKRLSLWALHQKRSATDNVYSKMISMTNDELEQWRCRRAGLPLFEPRLAKASGRI